MTHEPILVSIGEAADMLSVSQPTIYRLMRAKRLQSVKVGCRTLFSVKALQEFADALPHARPTPAS